MSHLIMFSGRWGLLSRSVLGWGHFLDSEVRGRGMVTVAKNSWIGLLAWSLSKRVCRN